MSPLTKSASERVQRPSNRRISGIGRVLVFVYGVLALAATGRSVFQIIDRFDEAPVAFTLSAVAAVVYIVATIALVAPGRVWYRVAWITITFELVGVLVIGSLSLFAPEALGLHDVDPFAHLRREARRIAHDHSNFFGPAEDSLENPMADSAR